MVETTSPDMTSTDSRHKCDPQNLLQRAYDQKYWQRKDILENAAMRTIKLLNFSASICWVDLFTFGL